MVKTPYQQRKRKYAKYPSCFGKLDCLGIMQVAMEHGMEVLCCWKPDMHCFNEVGLYGTPEQMRAVEEEWSNKGNTPKPRHFKAVFGVALNRPREHWLSVTIAEAKRNAISTVGSKRTAKTIRGQRVKIPVGYRPLRDRELPRKSDICWHETAEVWEPIDWESVERCGQREFKRTAYLILRRETKKKMPSAVQARVG